MVALAGAGAALLAFGVVSTDSGADARHVTPAVARLDPPLSDRELQHEVGPLPAPAGAAGVDLAQPSLMPYLHLKRGPKSGLAFDLADGTVLWRHHATAVRPIASLTKIMTRCWRSSASARARWCGSRASQSGSAARGWPASSRGGACAPTCC